ncbi:MAG: DUF1761 domain-containing protein [Candidatus Magasanikbacteria bacterium CG10_big_fil_rev_8_21_14_0_10_47_10]|uniref:DUF1761 domain-containing protein n=1 Tax=Candidatus Magasanikbacteria bacterium CG10_big_fil_rev_8_21_14_0_10_47_10 TaxID=1974652 RepID=A0A2H0TQ45_9BACT|nr:MAG: DUF1761 domain-containing protein [Candidatus Magasanikbacteria bacterium CG10_big_fil_rev_8_21_14_0_10_47_10]
MIEVNYVAILVAAVASFVVGWIWYGPLFGKPWMKMMGMTEKDKEAGKKKMGQSMALGFAAQLVMAYVIAHFIGGWSQSAPEIPAMKIALQTAFWLWLGLVATIQLGAVLWENKSWNLYLLNAIHWLVALLVMASTLVWLS